MAGKRQPFLAARSGPRGGAYYRSFAAASYPAVWQQYQQTPALQRHWYEVGAGEERLAGRGMSLGPFGVGRAAWCPVPIPGHGLLCHR